MPPYTGKPGIPNSSSVTRARKQQLVRPNPFKFFSHGYSTVTYKEEKYWLPMKSLHGDLLVGANGHCEGIQSLSIKIFREDHFRGSVLSSFLPGWMASLCNLPTICQWPLSFTSEWTEFSHSLKRHTNVPWPHHNGRAGNLPSLMMPVWPRLEEVESRNPKEAHSCTDPPLSISPLTSLSPSVLLPWTPFSFAFWKMTQLGGRTKCMDSEFS